MADLPCDESKLHSMQRRVPPEAVGIPYDEWFLRETFRRPEQSAAPATAPPKNKPVLPVRTQVGPAPRNAELLRKQKLQKSFLDGQSSKEKTPSRLQQSKRKSGDNPADHSSADAWGLFSDSD